MALTRKPARSGRVERILSGGDCRSLQGVEEVIAAIRTNPATFAALFECLFSDDEVVRMRAADALEKIARTQPTLFVNYRSRLLNDVAQIDQPSVQWHLAQILAEIELTPAQRARAAVTLKRNLKKYDDWIVVNLTLEALAQFARDDPHLRAELIPILREHQAATRRSIAKRAARLLDALAADQSKAITDESAHEDDRPSNRAGAEG